MEQSNATARFYIWWEMTGVAKKRQVVLNKLWLKTTKAYWMTEPMEDSRQAYMSSFAVSTSHWYVRIFV
jgi:hypothetical protein